MRTLALELRRALRSLIKRPAISALVILTIGLGLGANASIFAVVDALVLRPFTIPDVDRIVLASSTRDGDIDRQETVSPADFLDLRRQADVFERLAAFEWWDANLVGRDEPELVPGFRVSPAFFEVLGVRPAHGRGFIADEETMGRHRRVVLGDGLWRRRFAADPAVVGQAIQIDGAAYEVVGIAPPGFDFPNGSQIWAPLAFDAATSALRRSRYLTPIGRLARGRSLEDAKAQLAVIGQRLEQEYPETNRGYALRAYTLAQGMIDIGLGPVLSLWQASAVVVLLIACANVANLLLARGAERQREMAVRLAIGASRARVVRELLIESLVLALAAVPAAIATSWVGLQVLRGAMPAKIARFVAGWDSINVDGRLVAATIVLACGTAIVFGVVPALQASRPLVAETLKDGGRGATSGRRRLRRGLVVAEMALALPLLVASGLSALAVNRFLNGPQGYEPAGLLSMRLVLPEARYPDDGARDRFASAVVERLEAAAGAEEAAAVNVIPSAGGNSGRGIEIEGRANPDPANPPGADYRTVTPAALDVLRIPILRGRGFTAADRAESAPVAIVSQSLARRHWPDADPIGRRLRIANGPWMTVVGVSGDVIHNWFSRRHAPTIYRPFAQAPSSSLSLVVRGSGDPSALAPEARAAVRAVDPFQPVFDVMTMGEVLKERTLGLQFIAAVMAVFGGLALLLAVVGIYSVMAYLVTQRTHEIGVRIALGATPRDVLRLTVGQAGRLTAIGVLSGVALSIALGRLIEAGMMNVVSSDVRIVAGFAAVLVAAALAASYVPARRAAAVDPIRALRAE
jgi:putative ABC transport system permease protein